MSPSTRRRRVDPAQEALLSTVGTSVDEVRDAVQDEPEWMREASAAAAGREPAATGVAPPDPARIALALAVIAPLAFLMGMPFPLGLARLARSDAALVPWAFGINGCASVLAAAAATLIAMHAGFSATVTAAVVLYALAAVALRRSP